MMDLCIDAVKSSVNLENLINKFITQARINNIWNKALGETQQLRFEVKDIADVYVLFGAIYSVISRLYQEDGFPKTDAPGFEFYDFFGVDGKSTIGRETVLEHELAHILAAYESGVDVSKCPITLSINNSNRFGMSVGLPHDITNEQLISVVLAPQQPSPEDLDIICNLVGLASFHEQESEQIAEQLLLIKQKTMCSKLNDPKYSYTTFLRALCFALTKKYPDLLDCENYVGEILNCREGLRDDLQIVRTISSDIWGLTA